MLRIKVCGITRTEDALRCASLKAWALGFIFTKESSRYITPEQAKGVITSVRNSGIRPLPQFAGVFVNAAPEFIDRVKQDLGLDLIQLHGEESREQIAVIAPHIVACHLHSVADLGSAQRLSEVVDHLLVDSGNSQQRGGTGKLADWHLARQLRLSNPRIILAGGIGPDNILQAQAAVQPYAFDLSSKVEAAPGIKDHQKLDRLFAIAGGENESTR